MANQVQNIVENMAKEMPNNLFAQFLNTFFSEREYRVEHNQNAIKNKVSDYLEYFKTIKKNTEIENNSNSN